MSLPSSSLVAGIDVGNSSTEVVLARLQPGGITVIGTARAPTRRTKGSPESLDGAVALVRRLEREHGVRIHRAVVAWLRPVETLTTTIAEAESSTGRLRVAGSSATTTGGQGFAVGRPYLLGDLNQPADFSPGSQTESLVAVVPAGMGYRAAVQQLGRAEIARRVVAVVLADDEAVLVANRLGAGLPVVDEVDVAAVLRAESVAVEVAASGAALHTLTDSLRLVTALGLTDGERIDAARLARRLHDCGNAVVTVDARRPAPVETPGLLDEPPDPDSWVRIPDAGQLTFPVAHRRIVSGMVGLAQEYALNRTPRQVDDLCTVDLSSVADTVLARRTATEAGPSRSRAIGIAALTADAPLSDPSAMLAERLGVPVTVAVEARAAWAGGVSTPGAEGAATVVIDLGGGTVDAVSAGGAVVAAGGGQLLTVSVAALTGSSCAAAEWVKRGPAHRVETPQLVLGEDGGREFLDRPAPTETIGSLVVDGPAGKLAFNRTMAPGEWRALRLRLKMECLGGNVLRALRTLDAEPQTVIVVGGPAGDEEVLSGLARVLPDGVAIGRGDVGGMLGHRYAVAYGLLVLVNDAVFAPMKTFQIPASASGDSGST